MRFLFAFLLLASPLDAQTYVLVGATDSVKRFLSDRWEDTRNPAQVERAYCASWTFVLGTDGEPFVILTAVDSAATQRTFTLRDGRRGIVYTCPASKVQIHSHPPSSPNNDGTYSFGGINSNLCGPSINDLRNLRRNGSLFAVIQCDRVALAGYSLKVVWPKY